MAVRNSTQTGGSIPFWRDLRFWQVFLQVVFVIIVVIVGFNIGNNIVSALAASGQSPTFAFLGNRAGFDIGGADNYTSNDSFFEAFLVGVRNTLSVVTVGLVAATIIGVFFGVFLLSKNWLVRTLSRVYVEVLRNTPLLVQLILWYFVVFIALPRPQSAAEFPGGGVIGLSWRWLIYITLGVFIAFYFQARGQTTRNAITIGGLVAASVSEIGFWYLSTLRLAGTDPALATAAAIRSGSLTYTPFIVYVVVLAAAIGAVYGLMAKSNNRTLIIGGLGGALAGGALFYFGTIPGGYVFRVQGAILSMSSQGVYLPQFFTTPRYPIWLAFVTFGVLTALAQWYYLGGVTERTGRQFPRFWYGVAAVVVLATVGWFGVRTGAPPVEISYLDDVDVNIGSGEIEIVVDEGVTITKDRNGINVVVIEGTSRRDLDVTQAISENHIEPIQIVALDPNAVSVFPVIRDDRGRRYMTGTGLSPEYMAVLTGLVIYTSAFIAEIVRAGIQAVPNGQREAAAAVGLDASDTLSLIILPQALRVIIPPMGNQYLNLAKNSSLAIVASYADIFTVMNTVINQTGQSVSGIIIIMVSYLLISLTISFVMNLINQRFQLVTR
jgi:His/Glu/Gln/Arg/opine family amino acid ABC transporter permease subunit